MTSKIVDCPVCGIAMQKRIVRDGIELDFCGWHGVWLDAGELERILALQGGGQAAGRRGVPSGRPVGRWHSGRDIQQAGVREVAMGKSECYLCGAEHGLTREHIPPKGLFPEPRPSDLITVPCCAKCNHANHKADERFRLFVSSAFNRNAAGTTIWNKKVLERTIKKGRQRPFVGQMLRSATMIRRNVPYGLLRAPYVTVPQAEITPTLVRVAKGLLNTHFPKVPRNHLRFDVRQIDQLHLNDIIPNIVGPLRYGERGDGVFRYWGNVIPDAPDAGVWILLFYDASGFAVFHQHEKRTSQLDDFNQLMRSSAEGMKS